MHVKVPRNHDTERSHETRVCPFVTRSSRHVTRYASWVQATSRHRACFSILPLRHTKYYFTFRNSNPDLRIPLRLRIYEIELMCEIINNSNNTIVHCREEKLIKQHLKSTRPQSLVGEKLGTVGEREINVVYL